MYVIDEAVNLASDVPEQDDSVWTNEWTKTALIVVGLIVVLVITRRVILRQLERLAASTDNDFDDRLVHFLRTFLSLILCFVAFLLIMQAFDKPVTTLLAGAGIAGIALGFAAQETLADVLAGVFLILDRPMRVGDRVKLEKIGGDWGSWGDVLEVGLRRTIVRNTDGVVVNYPNHLIANSVITNFSHIKGPIRVRVRFAVDYDEDLPRASEVARAAIQSCPKVVPDSAEVVTRALWDTTQGHLVAGVLLEGRYRIEDVRSRTKIRSDVLQRLLGALRENGIRCARWRQNDGSAQ